MINQLHYTVTAYDTLQVLGVIVFSVGIYLIAMKNNLAVVTGNSIFSGAVLLVVCGLVVVIISLIGVLGAAALSWLLLMIVRGDVGGGGVKERRESEFEFERERD